jgi:hypothetical protein
MEKIAWAVLLAPETITHLIGEDNHEWWKPLAIFDDPLEAARWQACKFVGGVNSSLIQKVKITL